MTKYKKVERWKDIPGYEEYYQVSTYGRILAKFRLVKYTDKEGCERWKRVEAHLLNDKKRGKGGYIHVGLRGEDYSTRKSYAVHRLVAMAFIPNPNNLPIINHKDENPSNNHVDNLEWCTTEYNLNYGTAQIRKVETILAKTREKAQKEKGLISVFIDGGKHVGDFPLIKAAMRTLGIKVKSTAKIERCLAGELDSAYGYEWYYERDLMAI